MTRPTRHGAKKPARFGPARAARLALTTGDFGTGTGTGMYAIAIARARPEIRLLAAEGRALIVDGNADVARPVGRPRERVYGPAEARVRFDSRSFRILDRTPDAYHCASVVELNA